MVKLITLTFFRPCCDIQPSSSLDPLPSEHRYKGNYNWASASEVFEVDLIDVKANATGLSVLYLDYVDLLSRFGGFLGFNVLRWYLRFLLLHLSRLFPLQFKRKIRIKLLTPHEQFTKRPKVHNSSFLQVEHLINMC